MGITVQIKRDNGVRVVFCSVDMNIPTPGSMSIVKVLAMDSQDFDPYPQDIKDGLKVCISHRRVFSRPPDEVGHGDTDLKFGCENDRGHDA